MIGDYQLSEYRVKEDVFYTSLPNKVKMNGFIGQRYDLSRVNRLRHQEEDHLLFPFHEHCPAGINHPDRPREEIRGDWQGEYIGTWLDAAILSAWNADDDKLRTKIQRMLEDWLSTQEADGYLGTFDEKQRWETWDLWVQGHNLIGLLSYYRFTGQEKILAAAVKIADRVLKDFGPGKRYVYPTGYHRGMASSAILEPFIWLYFEVGDSRYLDFGRWLVDKDWEQWEASRIISSLTSGRGVANTSNAKGIEMLICFAGLLELYRATGEERYLKTILIAWEDIVKHHLYITGSATTNECFTSDYTLRNDGIFMPAETCVSMGWLYLNLSLGRLTGEAKYFDMAERTMYNHLLSAQTPDGRGWAYYVGLRDHKRYRWHIDPECCPTRGVRALAQIPQHVFCLSGDGIIINFYEPTTANLNLQSGEEVEVNLSGNFPFDEKAKLSIKLEQPTEIKLKLRKPGWCDNWSISINNKKQKLQPDDTGYFVIQREWHTKDVLEIVLEMPIHVAVDTIGNVGRVALTRGPLVYAADSSYVPKGRLLDDVVLLLNQREPTKSIEVVTKKESGINHLIATIVNPKPDVGSGIWRENERYHDLKSLNDSRDIETLELVPFFDAGNRDPDNYRHENDFQTESATNITYQVWLPYKTQ